MPNNDRTGNSRDIRCLVSYLGCFSGDDEGFEHPVEFYDEDASTLAEDAKDAKDGETSGNRPRRRWWLIALMAALLLLLVVIMASTLTTRERRATKNKSSASAALNDCGRRKRRLGIETITTTTATTTTTSHGAKSDWGSINKGLSPWTVESVRRLDLNQGNAVGIGCFRTEASPDIRTVTANTLVERIQACDMACSTNYFALSSSDKDNFKDDDDTVSCYCYVDRPTERLSIGPCHKIDVVYDICDDEKNTNRQEMEVFFDPRWDDACHQDTTSTVRNFLVEEDDVPFGFDIVTREFRPSPFELYKDECGTNMYEVQTEVAGGARELTTVVTTIEEDARRERLDLAGSIYGTREGQYGNIISSSAAAVAGMADRRLTNMFHSSGAHEAGSSVFSSFGVKRMAEVKIVDFENKRDFVTFNREFAALLRSYRQSGFARSKAQQIFRTYGMFMVTRGIFGGFLEVRSTMLASDVANLFSGTDAARRCYESFVSVRASNYGFHANAPTGMNGCGQNITDAFEASRRAYELDTAEADVVGGTAGEGDLVVSPATATLLTPTDMYPFGDNGLELRPLTDFLSPKVISPLEIKRYQLTEVEFAEIQQHLQSHIQEELSGVEEVLKDQCGDCETLYLEQLPDSWDFHCSCYEPVPPAPVHEPPPAVPVFTPIAGTYTVQIRRRGENFWGIGAHNQGILEISVDGDIIYNDQLVTEYEYDEYRRFLSWDEHGDILSRAELTFYTVKDDKSFFGDKGENAVANVFMGVIDDGWFAADEIRGFRQEEEEI